MIHSFLLIGQSNAAGRGFLSQAEPLDTCGGKLMVLRNGRWQVMFRPINPDRSFSGTSFTESFAKEYHIVHPDTQVGIIPCADGGTELSQWMPGELLYENAINCAKLALRTSHLKGILWHQGEGDCSAEKCALYAEKFKAVMDGIRRELGLPDIPIIIGGLGDFLANYTPSPNVIQYYTHVNDALKMLGDEYHNCAFVSAEGLGSNPDNLHFNAASLKEFGIRYFRVFEKFDGEAEPKNKPLFDDTKRSAMELL